MKGLFLRNVHLILIAVFAGIPLLAQTTNTTTTNTTNPTSPVKNDQTTTTTSTTTTGNQGGSKPVLNGFDGLNWGMKYEDVKNHFRTLAASGNTQDPVEILDDMENREILIKRRDIYYRYVFYLKPKTEAEKKAEEMKNRADSQSGTTQGNQQPQQKKETDFARFFFVEVNFALLPADNLYKKLQEKYGSRTNSSVDKMGRGAYLWQLEDGIVAQWIQDFEKKSYTRTVYYLSSAIRKEIEKDLQEFRFEKELTDLKNIVP